MAIKTKCDISHKLTQIKQLARRVKSAEDDESEWDNGGPQQSAQKFN